MVAKRKRKKYASPTRRRARDVAMCVARLADATRLAPRTRPPSSSSPRTRRVVVPRAGGKGKRKGARRRDERATDAVARAPSDDAGASARAGKSLVGALGPISRAPFEANEETSEHFILARLASAGDERWRPLGDVVHARGTNVDDVVRERYWILSDYAKRRHLKLNVGRGGIEIGVRVQKGPTHPRATTGEATEIVSVSDGSDVERWDEARGRDEALKYGEYPAILRLLNNAEPVTAAAKNAMLRASTQFTSSAGATGAKTNAPPRGAESAASARKTERVDKGDTVTFRFD